MPNEPIKGLSVPDTGTLPGTWGSGAINPDIVALAAMLGGVQSISLSSATSFALSAGTGSITPGAGPTQSQNAILKFSGTLNATAAITLPLPGYYILKNNCLGTGVITLRAVGTGNIIGLAPGAAWHVYSDGTDVEYVNMGRTGEFIDMTVATTPGWLGACTVPPMLLADGTIYSSSIYPVLSQMLGSTFGGNGASTFGVPDLANRVRVAVATSSPRLTAAISGINGTTMGAAGGSQSLHQHDHTATVQDNRTWYWPTRNYSITGGAGAAQTVTDPTGSPQNLTVGITVSGAVGVVIAATGAGASQNVQPTLVFGLTFIKT